MQQEKVAKRNNALDKKTSKENESSSKIDDKTTGTTSGRKTRGAKRQPEMLSPSNGSEVTSRKRSRKQNLSQANILNVIDEEELQKRAAHVGYKLLNYFPWMQTHLLINHFKGIR